MYFSTCSKDFAMAVKSCSNITTDNRKINIWEVRTACVFRKKEWINHDASVNEEIKTKYDGLGEWQN